MSKKDVEGALARGVDVLNGFLPLKSLLLFPLLYSTCVWAVRRVFDCRDRILAWQVWLDPEFIATKPDDFIVHFFATDDALSRAYRTEVEARDLGALRGAFPALYPIRGLEDAFLKGLFRAELEAGDFRTIVSEFAPRTAKALDGIRAAEAAPGFWRALEDLGREVASLGLHLIKDEAVQDMIIAVIKRKTAQAAKAGRPKP